MTDIDAVVILIAINVVFSALRWYESSGFVRDGRIKRVRKIKKNRRKR